jgi:hypothetical protein
MLYATAAIMLALWLLGLMSPYIMGGLIYVLLLMAMVPLLDRLIQGRRTA